MAVHVAQHPLVKHKLGLLRKHDITTSLFRDVTKELAHAAKLRRTDLPTTAAAVDTLLAEVRHHGSARVVDTLLPGIVAFCAPVFDADGHLVLGITTLGSVATFDPNWGGAIDTPLRVAAAQLSQDLGAGCA